MRLDAHGLPVSTDSDAAIAAFDNTILGYLKYRADLPPRLQAALAADADAPLFHILAGYFAMLGFKASLVPAAQAALGRVQALATRMTPRERAHAAALSAWISGEPSQAIALWQQILQDHPRDVLAFRLHHFNAFWLGQPEVMQAAVEEVLPAWDRGLPGYGAVLACRAFANEECGNYTVAESAGRAAIELDPGDLWATHAVAHILEMQGRRGEGIAWIEGLAPHFEGTNNLQHHVWWHLAMYRLERRDFAAVLALYDTRFRNLESALTQAQPDLYIDVQNAASMLFRLQRHGVAVGSRWAELATHAEARIGDCQSAFTLPHWMMALAGAGRFNAAQRALAAMREVARGNTELAALTRIALPVSEAVLHHGRGEFDAAVAAMRPVLQSMYRLGGSHAQQDVLEQLYLDAAVKADLREDARALLERVAGRHPVPPARRVGYAEAAAEIAH